jgi:subtilisin
MSSKILLCLLISASGIISFANVNNEYLVLKPSNLIKSNRRTDPLNGPKKMTLSEEQVRALQTQGFLVEKNHTFQMVPGEVPTYGPKETIIWPLSLIQADKTHLLPNGKGQGVRICLINTGIDQTRLTLKGSVIEGRNFLPEGDPNDLSDAFLEYGTNIAQVMVGSPQGAFVGVAPEAKLVIAKVFDKQGATLDRIIEAITYCRSRSDILHLSFGGRSSESQILNSILANLRERGITIFAGGSNNGPNLTYPANNSSVVAVGSVDHKGHVPEFSARDARLGCVAPGIRILVPDITGRMREVSGPGYAAAMVVGVDAIRRSRGASRLHYRDLGLSPMEQGQGLIDALLTATDTDLE